MCQFCFEWKSKAELTPTDKAGEVWDSCRQCDAEKECECPYTEWIHYPHQVKEHDQQCLSPCFECLNCLILQFDNEGNEPFMGDGYDPYQEEARY